MSKLYSATLRGKNIVSVFDIEKGIQTYSISLGDVEVINGPVITQDKMTIVVKAKNGNMTARVYNLPKCVLSYSFQIK
jgi:hypothetical protein